MPKRPNDYKFTKVKKHVSDRKKKLINTVRDCMDTFSTIYLFKGNNSRGSPFKDFRTQFKDSRVIYGKHGVIRLAFGRTKDEEIRNNLFSLTKLLVGEVGILFTNLTHEEVQERLAKCKSSAFARQGFVPSDDLILPKGTLDPNLFPSSLTTQLADLGMRVRLIEGVINLLSDFTVCSAGVPLTTQQAQTLKLLRKPLAEFSITLIAKWENDSTFTQYEKWPVGDLTPIDDSEESEDDTASSSLKKKKTRVKLAVKS